MGREGSTGIYTTPQPRGKVVGRATWMGDGVVDGIKVGSSSTLGEGLGEGGDRQVWFGVSGK